MARVAEDFVCSLHDAATAAQTTNALVFPVIKTLQVPLVIMADLLSSAIYYVLSAFGFIYSFFMGNLFAGILRTSEGYLEAACSANLNSVALSAPVVAAPFQDGSTLWSIAGLYFLFEEVILGAFNLVCYLSIDQILNFSTQDFSYLILSLNTSSVWLLFVISFIAFIFRTTLTQAFLIPKNSWQSLLETLYSVILGVVNENAGPKLVRYFPLIFTIFIIILACNLLGMVPYSFTVTSHLIVTFCTALAGFIGLNTIGIMKNRTHFLSLFFPPGAPMALAPLLVFIEFVSYVFRVLSLSIRLFANLMSGHTLLKILSGFA